MTLYDTKQLIKHAQGKTLVIIDTAHKTTRRQTGIILSIVKLNSFGCEVYTVRYRNKFGQRKSLILPELETFKLCMGEYIFRSEQEHITTSSGTVYTGAEKEIIFYIE